MKPAKPPARKLRSSRRISMIIPPDLVEYIEYDLKAGWKLTEIIVYALRESYKRRADDERAAKN